MTQLEKSIARLRARPTDATFDDVRRVLEAYGWRQARQKGSHVSFVKHGDRSITLPLRGGDRVHGVYVNEVCRRLGLDEQT